MTKVIIAPDVRLRTKSIRVLVSDDVSDLISELNTTMVAEGGLGLAAPQIASNKRVIVIDVDPTSTYDDVPYAGQTSGRFVMINPVIVRREGGAQWDEGCLSFPGVQEKINRSVFVRVEYEDADRVTHQLDAKGLLAACIQHEIDHLDGKLFIDDLSKLRQGMITKRLKKLKKRASRNGWRSR